MNNTLLNNNFNVDFDLVFIPEKEFDINTFCQYIYGLYYKKGHNKYYAFNFKDKIYIHLMEWYDTDFNSLSLATRPLTLNNEDILLDIDSMKYCYDELLTVVRSNFYFCMSSDFTKYVILYVSNKEIHNINCKEC